MMIGRAGEMGEIGRKVEGKGVGEDEGKGESTGVGKSESICMHLTPKNTLSLEIKVFFNGIFKHYIMEVA